MTADSSSEFIVNTFFTTDDEAVSSNQQFARVLSKINRIACSSHALDKVGSKDSKNAKKQKNYKRIHDNVMRKVKNLWKQKKKRKQAEIYKRVTGRKLKGPHRIRWLATFDAVTNFQIEHTLYQKNNQNCCHYYRFQICYRLVLKRLTKRFRNLDWKACYQMNTRFCRDIMNAWNRSLMLWKFLKAPVTHSVHIFQCYLGCDKSC